MKNKVLIIGKTPPPIGGVTIHVSRLLDALKKTDLNFDFLALNIKNILLLPFYLCNVKAIHLHSSNIKIQYYVVKLCGFFKVNSIVTFHKDLKRIRNDKLLRKTIQKSTYPVVLNDESYKLAIELNKVTKKISAFIPPLKEKPLSNLIVKKLLKLRDQYNTVYATNAFALSYQNDKEIYGIFDLIKYFNKNNNAALVISDPSKEYSDYIKKHNIEVKDNIVFFTRPHSFYELLKLTDGSIRNTSTDGDSLSIHESLFLNKITYATDVVSRPKGTMLYKRGEYNFIIDNKRKYFLETNPKTTLEQLIQLYSNYD